MTKRTFTLFIALFSLGFCAVAQSPFKPQLAVPVYFNSLSKKVTNIEKQAPNAFLSGIALMFLDTADTNDELLLSGNSDLVIWHDNVGQSTLLTLIVPDSQAIGKMELMFFDSKCTANLWRQDRSTGEVLHAYGDLETGSNGYALHFSTDSKVAGAAFADAIDAFNVQLMKLHTRDIRKAQVKSWYNKDSINVIVGKDYQFGTDNELFWLDQSLRIRLMTVASNDYSKLFLLNSEKKILKDSTESKYGVIYHESKPLVQPDCQGVNSVIAITFKSDFVANYMFFNPKHTYRLYIDYTFWHGGKKNNEFNINRFGLRNMDNGDFVDMDLFDFVSSGLPIVYIDLINGVVTDSYRGWDIPNAIHFIEDVFRASALPYE
ncbi:MAG: hypothetical protein K9J37_16285 [Saprospiraceae bacterium]|nr:hypothetical protein [Saprospiraceae bacterium]MCF8251473.1 hypothetical protein [Saprospiraceae bacterium]MCF8282217.1 hypothetical protein [Bacteroidales bacterium]MCF8313067.1 hypothetical protein [Saprospiraceae bacterium]MCF8441515.1 hypothetical protein [Saprospiraceae bacterium]